MGLVIIAVLAWFIFRAQPDDKDKRRRYGLSTSFAPKKKRRDDD